MASQVQICNLALLKFGERSILTIDDATVEARACKALWDLIVDEMLTNYPWNFAMRRANLGAYLADTPAFEFDYQYSLPNDCLRIWELYGSDAQWVVEGKKLLTNNETAEVRYIARIDDEAEFSPLFITCLSVRLAAELVVKLSGNNSMKTALLEELYKVWLPKAQQANIREGNPRLHKDEQAVDKGNFSWQTEGR